jgi:hypothetical protein
MLLEDWPSGVKFVLVDDDWGGGRKNDWFVTSEESTDEVWIRWVPTTSRGDTYDLLRMHT